MPPHKCSLCTYEGRDAYSLKRHERTHLKCGSCLQTFPTNVVASEHKSVCTFRRKLCALCSVQCSSTEDIENHLSREHNITIKKEYHEFKSEDGFKAWKTEIESSSITSFVRRNNSLSSVSRTMYFHCHRDGFAQVKSDEHRVRRIRKRGPNKINAFCPARMRATCYKDGQVIVEFVSTHVGHDFDVRKINLERGFRAQLASKMAENVPLDCILGSKRENFTVACVEGKGGNSSRLSRCDVVDRKDLHNIARDFRVDKKTLRESDPTSLQSWVKRYTSIYGSNFVRHVKSQGELFTEYSYLKREDFLLVLMNEAQLLMLKRFGNSIVSVDGTDGTNKYGFEVTTILVLDENSEVFPCAFLFSNRIDADVMKCFLNVISRHSGRISCQIFTTGITDIYYDAWVESMGAPTYRLYSSHYLDDEWRRNIRQIKGGRPLQIDVFRKLKKVQHEIDVDSFETTYSQLIQELIQNESTKEFGEYLSQNFLDNVDRWAYCSRPLIESNTNMHLERMHAIIEHDFIKGKNIKRIDRCLNALHRFLEDKLYDRVASKEKGYYYSRKLAILRRSHKFALKSTDTTCHHIAPNTWTCSFVFTDSYTVQRVKDQCENCDVSCKCDECGTCAHMFLCSCCDHVIKKHMCKHIHTVCIQFKGKMNDPIVYYELVEEDVPLCEYDIAAAEIEVQMLIERPLKRSPPARSLEDVKAKMIKLMDSVHNEKQLDALYEIAESTEEILQSFATQPTMTENDSSPAVTIQENVPSEDHLPNNLEEKII